MIFLKYAKNKKNRQHAQIFFSFYDVIHKSKDKTEKSMENIQKYYQLHLEKILLTNHEFR